MAKFTSKNKKGLPAISTASLPDIIFILLFFFMVVTVLRETEIKVKNVLPKATELTKLENKELVSYIYIGKPTDAYVSKFGDAPRIQLNDKYANANEIGAFVFTDYNTMIQLIILVGFVLYKSNWNYQFIQEQRQHWVC